MAFIELPEEPDGAELNRGTLGYVPNYSRVFAHRPEVYEAWSELNGAIKGSMDLRRYELATFAAARQLRSSYCSLAHGKVLLDRYLDNEQLLALVDDPTAAGLSELDIAVMDLATKVAGDAVAVTAADIDRLRQFGLNDAEIMDVVLTAAARCFFSKTLDALGVLPDSYYRQLGPDVANVLTVGRPIEDAEPPR